MDVDTRKAQDSSSALAEDIDTTFEIRKKAILHFMDNHDWDLFIGVITETDRLHHYLWIALDDGNHPQHAFFTDFYRKLDDFIGELYGRTGDETPLIIISDHGFTTIKKEIYLNAWLREQGCLSFRKDNPESLADMNPESQVFVLDPARFYIHLEGKYPKGSVPANEYEHVRQKLKEDLLSLNIDGEKVIKSVLFREELYSGQMCESAPDLVALSCEGYDLKGSINKTEISGNSFLTGGHTHENAVFFINRGITSEDVNIVDVGPTIMSLLGINGSFDGKSLV
jgi:predicted AlkP superfamily phosphohydrolase/phosphomutase